MSKTIRIVDPRSKTIRDTSPVHRRLEPADVAAALGAEVITGDSAGSPESISLYALRTELFGRLSSSGGRPALTGTTRRSKIPLADADWKELENLAASVAAPGFQPSAGQVASVLLSLSLRSASLQQS